MDENKTTLVLTKYQFEMNLSFFVNFGVEPIRLDFRVFSTMQMHNTIVLLVFLKLLFGYSNTLKNTLL